MKDVFKLIGKNAYANSRDSGSLKIVFFPSELARKQIRFWANVGKKPGLSIVQKTIKEIKSILGIRWANGVEHLSFYGGGRIICPFRVHFMQDSFEFTLWDFLGDKPILQFQRKIKSQNEMFTKEEIKEISGALEGHFHLVRKGFQDLQKQIGNPKNYNDYLTKINPLK